MSDHPPFPLPDTAYTMAGPRTGRLLDERFALSWPAEGICRCGLVVRRESKDTWWVHTDRKPGDSI